MRNLSGKRGKFCSIEFFLSVLIPKNKSEEHYLKWRKIEKSPLFKPSRSSNCKICKHLSSILENKRTNDHDILLFSHSIPEEEEFLSIISFILDQNRIKKVNYLEVNIYSERELTGKTIPEKKLNKSERFKLVKEKKFEQVVVYEIFEDKYF